MKYNIPDEMTVQEFRQMRGTPKRSKFNNRSAQSGDGKWFASEAERDRYEELLWLVHGKEITDLVCQPVLELQPRFKRHGKTFRPITYRADFSYQEKGKRVIEDVKGGKATQTSTFSLKWKMAQYKYPDYVFRLVVT